MSHLPLPKSPTSARGPAESPREPSERDEADQYPIPLHSPQETGRAHSPQLETSCSLASSQGCPGCSSTRWPSTRPHQEGTEESPGTPLPPPALSTLALLEEGSALPPTQWVPILLLPSEPALSAPIWSMGWKNPKENSLPLEGQVEETDNQRQKSLVNG